MIPGYVTVFYCVVAVAGFPLHAGNGIHLDSANLPWLFTALVMIVALTGFIFIRRSVKKERIRTREQLELKQQLAKSEMKALRNQMNPHFIFNAINSIQHYVLTNERELANRYLVKFSRLMRNILELSKEELITLTEELETARLYLEIESLRFNNAFGFTIGCESGIDPSSIKLPPLLVQPFIENAIWHGLLLKEGEKKLDISVRRNGTAYEVLVDDNGIGREMAGRFENKELKRRSIGMELTAERLELFEKAHGVKISYSVKDKTENGEPAGTTVAIRIASKKETER